MFKYLFISLLLPFTLTISEETEEDPECPPSANYTFNLLTLWWGPEFCQRQEGQCVSDWQDGWSGSLATIHGYWPSSAENSYLDCFGLQGDKNCIGFPYDHRIIENQTELLRDLEVYWPQISEKTTDGQYQHEWDKHGTCYLMNFMADNEEAYQKDPLAFNNTIFKQYFASTIDKAKKVNVNLISGSKYENKQQFALDIGLEATKFRIKCYGDDKLNEIQICYNRTEKPGEEVLIDCPPQLPFKPTDQMEIDCYEKPFYIV